MTRQEDLNVRANALIFEGYKFTCGKERFKVKNIAGCDVAHTVKTDKLAAKKVSINVLTSTDCLSKLYHLKALKNIILKTLQKRKCLFECHTIIDFRHSALYNMGIEYIMILDVITIDSKAKQKPFSNVIENGHIKLRINQIQTTEQFSLTAKETILGGLEPIYNKLERSVPNDSKSVLLLGPPGCGKTSLVKYLVQKTKCQLICAELSENKEANNISYLLKQSLKAQKLSEKENCIFFIDEFDSFLFSSNKQKQSILNQKVRKCLQACLEHENLSVFAATNLPYNISQEIRSIFYPLIFTINVPTSSQRLDILRKHSINVLKGSDEIINTLVGITPGFVGADLALLAKKLTIFSENSNLNPEDVIEKIKEAVISIRPSIYKSSHFMVQKPCQLEIGGCYEVKKLINQKVFWPINWPGAYSIRKCPKSKGILLYGPRGCGKTSIAKYMGSELSWNFISVSAPDLLSQYVGDSEKNISNLFHLARLSQPCIVFIDEIDGIFSKRDGSNNVHTSIMSEFLQEFDGYGVKKQSIQGASLEVKAIKDSILVVAATNHPNSLDDALLRPGRFDTLIHVQLPNKEARLDILKLFLKSSHISNYDNAILNKLADTTEGLTVTELENLFECCLEERMNRVQPLENEGFSFSLNLLLKEACATQRSVTSEDLEGYEVFLNRMSKNQ